MHASTPHLLPHPVKRENTGIWTTIGASAERFDFFRLVTDPSWLDSASCGHWRTARVFSSCEECTSFIFAMDFVAAGPTAGRNELNDDCEQDDASPSFPARNGNTARHPNKGGRNYGASIVDGALETGQSSSVFPALPDLRTGDLRGSRRSRRNGGHRPTWLRHGRLIIQLSA